MTAPAPDSAELAALAQRHFRFGFAALFAFALLGTALELLHAFKVGAYLDAGRETRRLMFTLAHAHGVGLSLLNVAFAAAVKHDALRAGPQLSAAALGLRVATLLLPCGFLLGAFFAYESDPGIGVLLAPVGAVVLLFALVGVLRSLR